MQSTVRVRDIASLSASNLSQQVGLSHDKHSSIINNKKRAHSVVDSDVSAGSDDELSDIEWWWDNEESDEERSDSGVQDLSPSVRVVS
jgi:hypothetical protein